MAENAADLIQRFSRLRVTVIGDAMLDCYTSGTTRGLCQEAPVPIVDLAGHSEMPGGAGNTAVNVSALGAKSSLIAIVGRDAAGERLRSQLQSHGVGIDHVICAADRQTLSKRRICSDGQLIARLDEGTSAELSPEEEEQVIAALTLAVRDSDAVIVSDYRHGVMTKSVIAALKSLRSANSPVLVVDSKELRLYRDLRSTAVKPNFVQVSQLLGTCPVPEGMPRWKAVQAQGESLLRVTGAKIVAATLDQEGAVIISLGGEPYRTYAHPSPHSQAAGAGDTFLSGLALALAAGATASLAGDIAATAAGVVVDRAHTASCTRDALLRRLEGEGTEADKLGGLANVLEEYRRQGRRIVFTNGCFDILHRGHITFLQQAKALADVLIVGVNADHSIRRLKGPDRPINSLEDRLRVLSALSCVDHLVSFEEDTPHRLIEAIRPDVFVKGGDYTREMLNEADLVEQLGGSVKILPFIEGRSTTRLISRIHAIETEKELHAQLVSAESVS